MKQLLALIALLVQRGLMVKAGQKLFELESQSELDDYFIVVSNEEQAVIEKDVIKPNSVNTGLEVFDVSTLTTRAY